MERLKLRLETITADRDAEKSMKAKARSQRDKVTSELTKALALLTRITGPSFQGQGKAIGEAVTFLSNQSAPADKGHGEPVAPFYICIEDFNRLVRDDTAIANVRVSREKRGPFTEPLYANQSAPADKGQGGPLSELEVLREAVKELEAMRDARVGAKLAQGEPVAWRGCNADGEVVTEWIDGVPPEKMVDLCGNPSSFDKIELAYAEQPAPVAVAPDFKMIGTEQMPPMEYDEP
ncbi:hypothetical protein JZ00_31435 [Pseudomonas frederiksbergensis]|uniref:Uncharacterized protein n=1 Tax=Pseudomonas frederiksbergensis TaxID=104087 RepID=A0A0U1PQH1_9PSED|nr:hypothetical protein JZ00_31435 [Pseudomonas frederiksbergensis]